MKLKYIGKYDLNPDSLPHKEHLPGAVPFKEPDDSKKMALIANGIAFILLTILLVIYFLVCGAKSLFYLFPASILSMLVLFPHELLHAICFKDEVYLYTNWAQGMLFVVGPETMSKGRFIFMSLLPNLIFGFIPYIIGLIFPSLCFLAAFGAVCLSMGAGDYFNVFNALTQMPKGARTYLHKFNSFWYMPE